MKKVLTLTLFTASLLFSSALNNMDSLSTPTTTTSGGGSVEKTTNLETVQSDAETKRLAQEAERAKTTSLQTGAIELNAGDKYFQKITYTSCASLQNLYCPPLKPEWVSQKYYTRLKSTPDLRTGNIGCDVLKVDDSGLQRENSFIPVASANFTNQACVQQFDKSNNQPDAETQALKNSYAQFQNQIKAQNSSMRDNDYKKNGSDNFLDFADWMDALVTVDPDKIDIAGTLTSGEVKVKAGYTIVPNALILADYKGNLSEIYSSLGGKSSTESASRVADAIKFSEKSKQLSNSKYVMYLDFFVKSNALIQDIAFSVFLIFLGWNVLGSWIFELATRRLTGDKEQENHLGRGLFGLIVVIMFFTSDSTYNVNTSKQIISSEETRIQGIIRLIYEWTNETADSFAKIAIESYLNNLGQSSNLLMPEAVDALGVEKQTLGRENKMLGEIYDKCKASYDTANLGNAVAKYRQTQKGYDAKDTANYRANEKKYTDSSGTFGLFGNKEFDSLTINPFPTEAEAKAIFNGANPYFVGSKGGAVKDGNYTDLSSLNDTVSLGACNEATNKQIQNLRRTKEIDKKFEALKDEDAKTTKLESLNLVKGIMWKAYQEYGYYSVAFLPATSIMVDAVGVLGDANDRADALDEVSEESIIQKLSEGLPMLALFGGQVPNMYNNIIAGIGDSFSSLVGATGGIGKKAIDLLIGGISRTFDKEGGVTSENVKAPGVLSYYLSYLTIDNILKSMVFIVLICGSVIAFIILALQKLWTFYASLFLIIHAFGTGQTNSIPNAVGKIIAVAFKTVLLVVSIFLAIYSINLLDVFQSLLIGDFYNQMREIVSNGTKFGNLFNSLMLNIQLITFYGVSTLTFIILKIVLATTVIFKLPSYFYDLLEVRVQDMGDTMLDTVNQAQESRNMRV